MRRTEALLSLLGLALIVGGAFVGLWFAEQGMEERFADRGGLREKAVEPAPSGSDAQVSAQTEPQETAAAPAGQSTGESARQAVSGAIEEARESQGAVSAFAELAAQSQPTERPEFDMVRAQKDGSAVIAGRAQPGVDVTVLRNGKPVEQVRTDARGEFVSILPPAPSPGLHKLTLRSRDADGNELTSPAPVLLTVADPATEAPNPSSDGLGAQSVPSDNEEARASPVLDLPASPRMAIVTAPVQASAASLLPPQGETGEEEVSIQALTYGADGDVLVAGRGIPGQRARVYLDQRPAGETVIGEDGVWELRMAQDIAPSRYTLGVEQVLETGTVHSRASTPFERIAVEDISLDEGTVIIQPGNTLWRIADALYGDGFQFETIYTLNRDQITDPNLIFPGQIFRLPTVQNSDG
ncbi:MAG: LysM peptidoglycan-binding domain-containing protein [Neomegalonema sp.]|nr:LysM peptidoglycan-binding domain-containing protein [Neomegalonema sp.]